jgi:hypothetical protein
MSLETELDLSPEERLRAVLDDPRNALDGDTVCVSSSDLRAILAERQMLFLALRRIAAPSFSDVQMLRKLAGDALYALPLPSWKRLQDTQIGV